MGYYLMGKRRSAQWGCLCTTLILVASGAVAAESEGSRGFTLYERFQGSSNTLGLATTLPATVFLVPPFSSQGFIMHLEGGASYSLSRFLSAGASAYAIVPSGEQTIYSKWVTPGKNATSNQGGGTGRGRLQGV